jgi:hypothetical protein
MNLTCLSWVCSLNHSIPSSASGLHIHSGQPNRALHEIHYDVLPEQWLSSCRQGSRQSQPHYSEGIVLRTSTRRSIGSGPPILLARRSHIRLPTADHPIVTRTSSHVAGPWILSGGTGKSHPEHSAPLIDREVARLTRTVRSSILARVPIDGRQLAAHRNVTRRRDRNARAPGAKIIRYAVASPPYTCGSLGQV